MTTEETNFTQQDEILTTANQKPRISVTEDKVKSIKTLLADGDKISKIARVTSLSAPTVYKIISKLEENDGNVDRVIAEFKKPGAKPRTNSTFLNSVGQCLQNDSFYAQNGIKESLNRNNISISQSSVCKYIKKLNLSRKRAKKIADKTLSPAIISDRMNYALKVRTMPNQRMLFLDETGFNLHTSRKYGYFPVGTECIDICPANRGRNISFLIIIGINRVLHKNSVEKAFNTEFFLEFLE